MRVWVVENTAAGGAFYRGAETAIYATETAALVDVDRAGVNWGYGPRRYAEAVEVKEWPDE